MNNDGQQGQANLVSTLLLVALIVAGIWVWNHLSYDTQDFITEDIIPIAGLVCLALLGAWLVIRRIRSHRKSQQERARLIARFEKESSSQKRLELAFSLIELNRYQLEGLQTVSPAMAELFIATLKTAIGDKQHRIRGMAASYLGVLQHKPSVPLLIQALQDDHAYVRGSAALALGRMRAVEAKEILDKTMREDWDQTVRSRAREAVGRMG